MQTVQLVSFILSVCWPSWPPAISVHGKIVDLAFIVVTDGDDGDHCDRNPKPKSRTLSCLNEHTETHTKHTMLDYANNDDINCNRENQQQKS